MVGKNIKRFREQKNIRQEELAEKLNVTRQAVSNWETEKTEPDIDTLHKIADILEVDIEELIYGNKRKVNVVHNHFRIKKVTEKVDVDDGIIIGVALATVISYVNWHSIGWALLHGLLNWIYVIYYIIQYGWS